MSANQELYVLDHASTAQSELNRLDSVHNAYTRYFGNRLSFAPLELSDPKEILEIGSGGGAWAIAAATRFPGASVTAIDQHPLPPRPLPPNLKFVEHDIVQPLPFARAKFDVVHCRLVMLHIPNAEERLQHIAEFVKPGGWLLVEDPDDYIPDAHDNYGVAHTTALVRELHVIMRGTGANPCIGSDLERILLASNAFSEVNVRRTVIPFPHDPATVESNAPPEQHLGVAWRQSYIDVARGLEEKYPTRVTATILKQFLDDLDNPHTVSTSTMYFTWSRRKHHSEL
ncbi:S-adenosyl-L-methionine-dependent methyltransferase [Favolaschia claudopus]|uniref:S-adenosyl-L-methionine-dependent methyltransferase n=1 Tax=Favolaschia claudopus TaxID=2862362 RepID=A0AAW0DVH7_9AGAR